MNTPAASNINLQAIDRAVDLLRASGMSVNAQEVSFLRTYPALLTAARAPDSSAEEAFLMVAACTYGWMEEILHVDPDRLGAAVKAFAAVRAEGGDFSEAAIRAVAGCLHSLVAASRVLHLANPYLYPIWDADIERFRRNAAPSQYHMAQTENYLDYVEDIRHIKLERGFLGFHHDYCMNYQERLRRFAIPPYPLTDLRVVQSAVSEIVGEKGRHA